MAKKATLSEEDALLLASIPSKPGDVDDAWAQLCDTLEARFADDPDGLAAILPAIFKALGKWSKLGQWAPQRWLLDPGQLGHLLAVCQHLILFDDDRFSDVLPAVLACPMPRLRTIELHSLPVSEAAFAALGQNESLGSVVSVKLSGTGLTDAGLAALLQGEALWSGLTTLMISETRVRAKAAQLLADSPRVADLNVLSLRGCPIGEVGRRALGASAHLSDRAKGRSRAEITASNEAVVAAPPTPHDLFGDMRSALQSAPSVAAWDRLCDMFDRLEHSPERERVQQELIPYAQSSLERWPAALRVAPAAWVDQLMDGQPAPAPLKLATSLHIRNAVRADRLKHLAKSDALCDVTRICFQDNSVSPKALTTLLKDRLGAQLTDLELRCADQRDGLLDMLTSDKGPTALERLTLHNQEVTPDALKRLGEAPFAASLRHLRLSSYSRNGGQLAAILNTPIAAKLHTLHLRVGATNRADNAILQGPLALTSLSISNDWATNDIAPAIHALVKHSPDLESLSLRGQMVNADSILTTLFSAPLPGSLRSLTLFARPWLRLNGRANRLAWAARLPGSLRALHLIGDGQTADRDSLSCTLMASPQAAHLTALSFDTMTLDAQALRGQPVSLPALTSLALKNCSLSADVLQALAQNAAMPALSELVLRSPALDFAALARLAEASWWPALRALTANPHNRQYEPSPDAPGALRRLPPTLEALDLSNMPINNAALDAILASPAARTLRRLRLSGSFTQRGLLPRIIEALPSLPSLELLDLSNNQLQIADTELIALAATPAAIRLHRVIVASGKLPIKATRALMESNNLLLSAKEHLQRPFATQEAW